MEECKKYLKEYEDVFDLVGEMKGKNKEDCIRKLAKKLYDKLDHIRSIFEEVLNPDISDLAISYEIKGINFDYNKIWKKYKKVLRLQRLLELCELKNKGYEEFLEEFKKEFNEILEVAEEVLKKKISFWEREISFRKPKEYLG